MTTFATNTGLNARGRRLTESSKHVKARVCRRLDGLSAIMTRRTFDPLLELAKAERREAARRAVDNLLR